MLLIFMGAGAVSGLQKESSGTNANCQETPSSTTPNTVSGSTSTAPPQSSSKASVTVSGPISSHNSTMKMSCEMCSTNFTLFRRKKFCQECHRYFCKNCLPKPPSTKDGIGRQCSRCLVIMSGQFSRSDLLDWNVKDMRGFLNVHKISMIGCKEKHDLIELVLAKYCTKRRNSLQDQMEHDIHVQNMAARMHMDDLPESESGPSGSPKQSNSASQPNTSDQNQDTGDGVNSVNDNSNIPPDQWRELFDSMERIQETLSRHTFAQGDHHPPTSEAPSADSPRRQRCHLDNIQAEEDVERLTVKQMKELLVNNFVNYKGCCEKPELVERVKRLWRDHQINKGKAEKIHLKDDEEAAGISSHWPSTPTKSSSAPKDAKDEADKECEAENPVPAPEKSSSNPGAEDESQQSDTLCRVCMDSLTDCILLECGHMVTCTTCGKQLAECPICRQYIVRVVRVFKS